MSLLFNPKVELRGPYINRVEEVLTPDAIDFVVALDRQFAGDRADLLDARMLRQKRISEGQLTLDFLEETRHIREDSDWTVAGEAPGLVRRVVEITGPPTPTMTVNALNSGADVWMADFEDATTPTWSNLIEGHLSVLDALDGTLDFTNGDGKRYRLRDDHATIVVRPRGWHLVDKFVIIDGRPISGSLLDFGLHFFHGAHRQLRAGNVPAFYLPKLESHLEARLWNNVFNFAQDYLGIPRGTIRATVLIETIPAAFEMDEILFELRDHAAGLNAGRWDYIFSTIKYLSSDSRYVLPDRAALTMTVPFMRAYTELLIRTCHRRGAHAIGGMAANVPLKSEPHAFAEALARVRADKDREAADGFDGSWVAHPNSVAECRAAFDAVLQGRANQKKRVRDDSCVTAADLLSLRETPGSITEVGIRGNLRTSLRYLAAWLDGNGAVALDGLMEDAATVEIARSQLWQWRAHNVTLGDGRVIDEALLTVLLEEEQQRILSDCGGVPTLSQQRAHSFLGELLAAPTLDRFFTTTAYARWIAPSGATVQRGWPVATTIHAEI